MRIIIHLSVDLSVILARLRLTGAKVIGGGSDGRNGFIVVEAAETPRVPDALAKLGITARVG
jgi:hypothetical protein